MKAIQEDVKAKKIPFKTDKDIVREVIQHTNRGHETGMGRYFFTVFTSLNLLLVTTPQAFSSPNYTPPNFDGYRPIFEHESTSQIVRDADLDGDDLDVDGDQLRVMVDGCGYV
ncbi:hypothetical protein Tco_0010313 [Tanacetum coccineum]